MTTVLFDVTRLYMRGPGSSITGIDRVTQTYGRWLLSLPDVEVIPVCTWGGLVAPQSLASVKVLLHDHPDDSNLKGASWRRLASALRAQPGVGPMMRAGFSGGGVISNLRRNGRTWRRYAAAGLRAIAGWRPRPISPGDIYINVSHYGLEQVGLLPRLRAHGVRIVVMLHDLIPISHPEYCSPSAEVWHRRRVISILGHADLVITNSDSTAADAIAFANQNGLRVPPLCVALLGIETPFLTTKADVLEAPPYFVCVGTIEPRKNLTFLLTLWRHLAERLGERTPPLVLVGARGWENESVIDHLDRSPPVQRFVHEAAGLSDAELAQLIAGARALLSPSFIEGFNLPLAEALSLGTPAIASDIAVHRELGRNAQLIDPLDGPRWLAAIEAAFMQQPTRRPALAPSWSDHFAIISKAIGLTAPAPESVPVSLHRPD